MVLATGFSQCIKVQYSAIAGLHRRHGDPIDTLVYIFNEFIQRNDNNVHTIVLRLQHGEKDGSEVFLCNQHSLPR